MTRFPTPTALSIAAFGLVLTLLPRLAPAIKGPTFSQFAGITQFDPARTPLFPVSLHPVAEVEPPHLRPKSTAPPLLDDRNGGLDSFYAALWRTERKLPGAITRIGHYGDSPTTADLITGDVRAQLQAHYGDAGHGFILLAKPWAWYQHRGVSLDGSGWQISPVTHNDLKDGSFGLGGVSFTGNSSAHSKIKWDGPPHSIFELYYLQQSNGGTVTVTSDEKIIAEIPTAGDSGAVGFTTFTVPGGIAELELHPEGPVRLFGLVAEKPGPGIVYDTFGLNGATTMVISHNFDPSHWAAELRHRNPNLVVINYGTNEADFDSFIDHQYEKELREAIRRIRYALPDASILIMSPMDRGYRTGPGDIETMPSIPRLVAIQRRVAQDTGCGFFDTFTAMGGAGTMARWYASQPRLVSADFIHPNPAGGKIIATVLVKQLESGLARYKLRSVHQSTISTEVR